MHMIILPQDKLLQSLNSPPSIIAQQLFCPSQRRFFNLVGGYLVKKKKKNLPETVKTHEEQQAEPHFLRLPCSSPHPPLPLFRHPNPIKLSFQSPV